MFRRSSNNIKNSKEEAIYLNDETTYLEDLIERYIASQS